MFEIERLLKTATERGFTESDFADLAISASKRSGATKAEQTRVAANLGIEIEEPDRGTKSTHVSRLGRICKQLGGRLAIVSRQEISTMIHRDYPDYDNYDSPEEAEANSRTWRNEGFRLLENSDDHGHEWAEKIIYVPHGDENVGHIIQAMGQVFADSQRPNSSRSEWKWFGWEIAIARRIGAWQTWSRHQDYRFVGDVYWSDLTTKRRQAVIAERVRYAKKIGILSEAGEPRSIR